MTVPQTEVDVLVDAVIGGDTDLASVTLLRCFAAHCEDVDDFSNELETLSESIARYGQILVDNFETTKASLR